MTDLFDPALRRLRRDRAARQGAVTFLHRRAMEDMLDRIRDMNRSFERVLLVGAIDGQAVRDLDALASCVDIVDPSPLLAKAAGGQAVDETKIEGEPATYDLAVALGTLDTVGPIGDALLRLRLLLKPDAPLLGVVPGGDILPTLRHAMAAADRHSGEATPHFHPRLDPAGLTALLASQGFVMPVVDVDRITIRYANFEDLVRDLRGMAATNLLTGRSRKPFPRAGYHAVKEAFSSRSEQDGKVSERIELLHFIGWNPTSEQL